MSTSQRIVIRGTNWIGDSVMSLPALRELRRLFPEHHLALLVRPWVSGLFTHQGLVDEVIVMEDNQFGWRSLITSARKLRTFDTAVLFQNAFGAALTAFLARIPERIGYDTDGRGLLLTRRASRQIRPLNRHQAYYYLDLLYQAGLSPRDYLNDPDFLPDIHLSIGEPFVRKAKDLLRKAGVLSERPLILINPGAYYGPAKRWLPERYAELAEHLIAELNAEVAFVGSAGELRLADEIKSLMKTPPKILSGQTDLQTLMGLLSLCKLFLTNDSGPMHLAAAVGTPQVALFGSTDERATGPLSPKALIIHKHVECSPCLLRECPIDLRCFKQIEVEEVYQAAQRILGV